MPDRKAFDVRGVSNSRPTALERGLTGPRELSEPSQLERWTRARGYALDFDPRRRERPVSEPSALQHWADSHEAALDFTPADADLGPSPPPPERSRKTPAPSKSEVRSALIDAAKQYVPEGLRALLHAFDRGGPTPDAFVALALAQTRLPYSQKLAASPSDLNPQAFDCSSLVRWCAARLGLELPRTCAQQLEQLRAAGALIPVERAIRTRGALLFHAGHVAISLGNGRTIEAMGKDYGIREGSITKRDKTPRFTEGALLPGLRY
jgi:cell wall-associated NlpC family hydrolase